MLKPATQLMRDLIAVRDRLGDPARWMKGSFYNEDRSAVCLWYAIRWCTNPTKEPLRAYNATRAIEAHLPSWAIDQHFGNLSVQEFNDHPATTHVDVMNTLDKAIIASL